MLNDPKGPFDEVLVSWDMLFGSGSWWEVLRLLVQEHPNLWSFLHTLARRFLPLPFYTQQQA